MKLYYCTNFGDDWPVGVSAIVWAKSNVDAAQILTQKINGIYCPLEENILPEDMIEFKKSDEVVILTDGDY